MLDSGSALGDQSVLGEAERAQGLLMDFNEIEILEMTVRIAGERAHEPLADIEAGGLKGGRRDRSRRAMHPADDKNGHLGHVGPVASGECATTQQFHGLVGRQRMERTTAHVTV